jgi:hypothetical protein
VSTSRLRVVVDGPVDPRLVAPALRRRLAGEPWPDGAERQIAEAVLAHRDGHDGGDEAGTAGTTGGGRTTC